MDSGDEAAATDCTDASNDDTGLVLPVFVQDNHTPAETVQNREIITMQRQAMAHPAFQALETEEERRGVMLLLLGASRTGAVMYSVPCTPLTGDTYADRMACAIARFRAQ